MNEINTYSIFYYGYTVTKDNNLLPFSEGGPELLAELNVGAYSLTSFLTEIARAMNVVSGGNNYSAIVDRDTRRITISGDSNFEILALSSSLTLVSIFDIAGYDRLSDKLGSNSYEGELASGSAYEPQFKLQSYIDFENSQRSSQSSVNESASGVVEVISYGKIKTMKCNITLANDLTDGKNSPIKVNSNGVSDLRLFMEYLITKGDIEFMPDIDDRNSFTTCFLESTTASQNGTGFELNHLQNRGLRGFYETGLLRFRKVGS